jgi:hypothetical protein
MPRSVPTEQSPEIALVHPTSLMTVVISEYVATVDRRDDGWPTVSVVARQ